MNVHNVDRRIIGVASGAVGCHDLPLALGTGAKVAVGMAVLCEDVALTVYITRYVGAVDRRPVESVDSPHDRYQNIYGQRSSEGTDT